MRGAACSPSSSCIRDRPRSWVALASGASNGLWSARGADEVPARGVAASPALVQRRLRHAEPAAARAAPGHRRADRAGRPRAALPDGADPAGGQRGSRRSRSPRRSSTCTPLAADAALPGAPARAGGRDEVAHLLQVRGRQPAGQPQAEHRRGAGVLQQAGGPHAALDRDRRRPVGERARVRVQADRPRVQGVHGSDLVRAEAVPALDDPAVGRGDRREPVERHPERAARFSRSSPTRPAASGSRSPRRSRTPRSATTPRTRSAACSTTCSCTRR